MDKRKQFQLQLFSNKLLEYNTTLANLKTKQSELLNTLLKSDTSTDKTSDSENTLVEQKTFLETKIQKYKNELTRYRNEYTSLNNQIKLLPQQMATNKQLEHSIYDEEIQHIAGRTQEADHEYLDKLESLEIEKSLLVEQIQEAQNQLIITQENISNIQEQAHTTRKQTLLELQQKKQQKLKLVNSLNELNKNKELYSTNQIDISNQLEKLIQLKTDIINTYYANSQNINQNYIILEFPLAKELLPKYILFEHGNSAELLNTIVSYLDKQIQDSKYQLSNISKNLTRLEKSITITTIDMKSKLNPSNISMLEQTRIVSYKDNYKNAKLEKTSLETEIKILQAKLNCWDIEIIAKVKEEYKIKLESLEQEKLRAYERLTIMSARINNEYELNTTKLANYIKEIENELSQTNNSLQQTNLELTNLLETIKYNKSTKIELEEINKQIAHIELAIQKLETDIASLGSV